MSFFFFFFQAEDGIRDWSVTGVQTCALPIYVAHEMLEQCAKHPLVCNISIHPYVFGQPFRLRPLRAALKHRSEERRVGKECRSRWGAECLTKKREDTDGTRVYE